MTVHVERQGAVTTVVIDRPAARNAVDRATAEALLAAFHEFDADADAAVAVLCASGGHFCAGADLKSFVAEPDAWRAAESGDGPLGPTRMLLSKPVIGAIEGYAVAGGLELALWCDLRVADATAAFGVLCRRWGVPLIDGGTIRLPRLIGQSRALDMILTGRLVYAEEALAIGLANRVVAAGNARAEAEALAARIAAFPQACMRHDRLSSYEQWGLPIEAALANECRHGMASLASGDALEGAARFGKGEGRHGHQPVK